MLHNISNNLTVALLALLLMVTGCQQEDIQFAGEQDAQGRIVLSLSDIEVYVDAQTRSTQTLSDFTDYVFTLTGTTAENVDIDGQEVEFESSTDINGDPIAVGYFDAGTYTLTVSNRTAAGNGYSAPYWEGTSARFSFAVGGSASVSIDMGRPKNAKAVVDSTSNAVFSAKYEHVRLTLSDGTHSTTIAKAGTTGCSTEAYFPAGSVGYTLTARAKSGSHVTDIVGATGTIAVEAGKAYTLTLSANPVTGELIPIVSGSHTGEFD